MLGCIGYLKLIHYFGVEGRGLPSSFTKFIDLNRFSDLIKNLIVFAPLLKGSPI